MSRPWDPERARIEAHFGDENEIATKEELSPSGRFRLTLRTYSVLPGAWHYSRGTVVRVSDGREVCDIRRNYPDFTRAWLVKDGVEWLITGRSYMSQTIIDLDTGEEYEPPGNPYESHAFCWARCFLSPDGNTLVVDGCIWACPYELRFFDFTDPTRGWPELQVIGADQPEPDSRRDPEWIDASTVDCLMTEESGELASRTRLRRDGDRMVAVEVWVSDAEEARRREIAVHTDAYEAWRTRFEAEDPLFAAMREAIAGTNIPDTSIGYTWIADPDGNRDAAMYFRRKEPHGSADLRWGTERGAIEVILYDGAGNRAGTLQFERGVAGMREAMARIAEVFAV